jgi:hypothetical protein
VAALAAFACALGVSAAHAGDIPIVTLSDSGPDQEVPTDRAFYVAGSVSSSVQSAQAIVVRRGSPAMFGDDGPDCHDLISDLQVDVTATAADDEEGEDDEVSASTPHFVAGMHRAFEVFPDAVGASRRAAVLVSSPWQRGGADDRQFRALVPHDRDFFSAGYGYCMFIVTTEHTQELDRSTLVDLVDDIASKIVACGDKSSCDTDALAEYETAAARALASSGSAAIPGQVSELAGRLAEAARVELGSATGIVEAIDRMGERWRDRTTVMTPTATSVWAPIASDPFAQAVATLLSRAGALLPQVRAAGKSGAVALFTNDGKLQVTAIQLLDDGRSIRVASSQAPKGGQVEVPTATTDTLVIADGLTLYDLIQLGNRKLRVDKQWVSLNDLGEKMTNLGQEHWSSDDTAYLASAAAQLRRLSNFVDLTTTGVSCTPHAFTPAETEQSIDAVRQHLGEWLACQKVDAPGIETMREQIAHLLDEEQIWRTTKDKLVGRSQRIVTLTTTAPTPTRVAFRSRTWVFSYVTPIVGYAGVLRPDETFGVWYLGAQIHFWPNPVGDVQWRDGVTTRDLHRAVALELGIAPTRSAFGPEMRYGNGSLPPLFIGAAVHVIPYTSITFGGAFVDRRNSTLPQEDAHTVFTPYVAFTLQLNLPDLVRDASRPATDTMATR